MYLLQRYLSQDKTLFSPTPNGYFGPATETAVKRFQLRYNLLSDSSITAKNYGVFEGITQAKFIEIFGTLQQNVQ